MGSVNSGDALSVIFSGSQLAANAKGSKWPPATAPEGLPADGCQSKGGGPL